MIILVRCRDGIYSIALESRVEELVEEGLVSAVLHEGEWKNVGNKPYPYPYPCECTASPSRRRIAALVSSF